MNDQHPAIVIGEPIPEVEPRVDSELLDAMLVANRICRWIIVLIIVSGILATVMHIGIAGRLIWVVVILLVLIGLIVFNKSFHLSRRASKSSLNGVSTSNRQMKWSVPFRVQFESYALFFLILMAFQLLVLMNAGLSIVQPFIGFFLVYAGIGLVSIAAKARQPGQVSCIECSYSLVGLTLPCMCPECGVSILDASRTSDRPRVRLPWVIPVGVLCIVFGGLISVSSFNNSSLIYKTVPSGMLQRLAVNDRKAFDELTAAPMNAKQTQSFVELLLESHESGDLAYKQSVWLWDQMVVGAFTKQQMDRMLAFIPEIEINALEAAHAGESVEISLRSVDPDPPNSRFRPYYFFGGFEINGDDQRHAQSSHYKEWKYLYQDMFRSEFSAENPKNRPFHTLMHAGDEPIEITAHVVVVIGDPRSLIRFDWDEEQKPVFNFQPVWYRVIEIEHTIEVIED